MQTEELEVKERNYMSPGYYYKLLEAKKGWRAQSFAYYTDCLIGIGIIRPEKELAREDARRQIERRKVAISRNNIFTDGFTVTQVRQWGGVR